MLFLFVSALWGFLAMTDTTCSRGVRIFGGVMFAFFGSMMVLGLTPLFKPDAEHDAVLDAVIYAAAVANQRMPERTVSIDLPGSRPSSVKSVAVAPNGRVRVMLSDDLKKTAGGAIVLTPSVENGVINWTCASGNVPAGYLGKSCN
jgi:Pilin (bacterial filament)